MSSVTSVFFPAVGVVDVKTVDVPVVPLSANEVRIAPQYLGICGSDLHLLAGGHPFAKPPTVPGHEICAIVTEVGADVDGISIGHHVVVDPLMPCLHCRACKAGRYNLCEPPMVAGFRVTGFGETSHVVPARNIHIAPISIPLEVLAFAEPATCARHCVTRMPPDCRENVLLIGAGTIGLSILQAMRIMGARHITVAEPDPDKRALASSLGADRVVAPGELTDETFTGVVDVVSAQTTLTEACTRVVAGGTVVCMGVPSGPREIPLPSMQRFERDLISSGMYTPADFDVAISWLADGQFSTKGLITDVFSIEDAPAAYCRAREETSIKVLIKLAK